MPSERQGSHNANGIWEEERKLQKFSEAAEILSPASEFVT